MLIDFKPNPLPLVVLKCMSKILGVPKKNDLLLLETQGLASIVQLEGVGVEKFAEHAWRKANEIVNQMTNGRCKCVRVECAEHGANSAIYEV